MFLDYCQPIDQFQQTALFLYDSVMTVFWNRIISQQGKVARHAHCPQLLLEALSGVTGKKMEAFTQVHWPRT